MNTFYWLVKREFWEHRGGFFWAPIVSTVVVLLLNILILLATGVIGGSGNERIWNQLAAAAPKDLNEMGEFLDFVALMPVTIIYLVMFFVLFGYCLKTLSSDRVDRSILFWKSLPISDLATVGSKAFSAIVLAPVIATVCGIIGAFLMLLIYAINASFHGIDFGQVLWTMPHTGHLLAAIASTLPIYMAWMLPCVGWFMLCSAWAAGGKVARWATALPVGVGAIIAWLGLMKVISMQAVSWFWGAVLVHGILGVFPGSWLGALAQLPHGAEWAGQLQLHDGPQAAQAFAGKLLQSIGWQYHLFASPQMLWGILAGLIMLAGAVWLRRWRTEL